jgi:hypothetical protein
LRIAALDNVSSVVLPPSNESPDKWRGWGKNEAMKSNLNYKKAKVKDTI